MLQLSQLYQYQEKYQQPGQLSQHKRFESQPLHLISPVKSLQQGQQVQELKRIREKLEYYNEGNRKKPFEQVIEEMDFKYKNQPIHLDPTQTTLNEIDRLHNDYLNSGMRDPIYLNSLQKLRHDFLKQSQPIGYYVRAPIQQSYNSSYKNHPIYDYLPASFKKELNQQNSLPILQHNRQKTDFSGSINEQMLSYMRNEENEAVRQLSMDRLSNIQMIKTSIENEVVKERINKMAQEMTMKRQRGFEQSEDVAVPYSQLEGLSIKWDIISKLPIQYIKARISFGIFKQSEEYHAYKLTSDCFTQAETFRTNKCIFNQIEQMRDIQADDKTILYIELWVFESDGTLSMLGWSIFKLFDRIGSLYIGKFKLPFYQQQHKPRDLLEQNKQYPYYGNLCLYFRIMQQPQHIDEIIFVESDYHIPYYHIHRESKIIRSEVNDKAKLPKDLAQVFAYDKPLREREPQLFGDPPLSPNKKKSTIKPNFQITDEEYFGDEKQKESPTTSIQQKHQVKSRFSRKIDNMEHLPTQEKNSQQSSDAIIRLGSLKPQDNLSQRGSNKNIRIQLIQEDQVESKRNIEVKEQTRRVNGDNTIRGGDKTVRGDRTNRAGGQTNRHLIQLQQQEGVSNQMTNVKNFNKLKRKLKAIQGFQGGDQTIRSSKNIEIPQEVDLGSTKNKVVISGAGIVVIDILKLNNLDTKKYNELKLKIGFFINDIILKDENETDCVMTQNLIPNEITDKSLRYNLHAEFSLDYANILSILEQEGFSTKDAYVYIAVYQNNALLGWYVAQLLKDTEDSQKLQIESGLFQVNLIKPPGQQAPFDYKDMIKSNIQLDFVLMSKNEQLKNLPTINKYEIQEEAKVKTVENPEWNTQIMIQLLQAYNFVSKEELQISISIQFEQKIIDDVLQRQCQVKDDLDIFSSDSKNIYNSHYYTTFRVGKKYLQDTYSKYNLLNYVIIIHQNNQFLGMAQLNVFKKFLIQSGEFRLNLYTINNKKLNFEIKLLIKEVALQLDIYERTPSYRMSKSKGGYTQQEEDEEIREKDQKQQQNISRFLPITIQIQEVELKNRKVVLKILKNNEIVKQQNDDDCIQEMIVPNSAVFYIDMEDMLKCKEGYFVMIEVYDDVLIGWFGMNMVFNKKLYTTKLYTELYRSPRLSTPLDHKLIKKLKEKIELQIHQGDVRTDIRKLNQKQKTGLDIHIHSISNLPSNGDNQIVIQLINDGRVIQDKLLKLCQIKQNMNIVNGYIRDLSFNYNLNKGDVPKNSQLGIYISQQDQELRWCIISLYSLGKLKVGKVEKKMFMGPFNKTNKVSNTDICLEIE
ncbi:unnamed protein product [Paramecium sonneborni]|uniref:C2 domain-containing protein n=1 Tax=Paramecium sonneborni TaxID=65129 RepID=A0A8S1PGG3_9CILI|nr:unnamed protein product [Paramecium sonneborni]